MNEDGDSTCIHAETPGEDYVQEGSQQSYENDDENDGESDGLEPPPPIIIPLAGKLRRSRSAGPDDSGSSSASPTTTLDTTPSQSSRCPSSVTEMRNDREIITMVCTSCKHPEEVHSLDLSTVAKRTRRSLKSLRALGEFVNLTHLNVSSNAIASVDGVDAFPQLDTLSMSRNHLKRIGSPVCALTSLRHLDLSGNFISHIPKAIVALELLETLNLSGNNLSVLKEVDPLGTLMNLHVCSFTANPFCKLPTYKDYVICKLPSLEKLDESMITTMGRDKSRKRFSDDMFSKDTRLRAAGIAHEQEQNKLREAQSALEAENLRLKGELQVKSKLLRNKSKEWSSATGQLLQLQQEVAMLNLDRRGGSMAPSSLTQDEVSSHRLGDDSRLSMASIATSASSPSSLPESLTRSSQGGSLGEGYDSVPNEPDVEFQLHQPLQSVSPKKRSAPAANSPLHQNTRYSPLQSVAISDNAFAELANHSPNAETRPSKKDSHLCYSKQLIDSACSPLRSRPYTFETRGHLGNAQEVEVPLPEAVESPRERASTFAHPQPIAVSPQPGRSKSFDHVRRAFSNLSSQDPGEMLASIDRGGVDLAEDDSIKHDMSINRSIRFPTFEDDLACPAYEDEHHDAVGGRQHRQNPLHLQRESPPHFYRTSSSPGRLLSFPSPSPSPRSASRRMWQRHQAEFRHQTLGSPQSKSPLKGMHPVASIPVDRDMLARQIQALQSCKQSLVGEIAKEEQLLHVLKQEAGSYSSQIDQLHLSIQACLSDAASYADSSGPQSPRSLPSKKQREEENYRAKLEFFRNKLRFAEDKEKEIEMTMVRTTKRVLQSDLQNTPFDKEIFALTHKLQQVIVQKEEIHLEMSRLMTLMREQQHQQSAHHDSDHGGSRPSNGSHSVQHRQLPTVEDMLRAEEQQEQLNAENRHVVSVARKKMDELRRRYRDVLDRIRVKEELIASFVEELKDVEKELALINQFSPPTSPPPLRRPRSVSLDFHPMGTPSPSQTTMDAVELELAEALRHIKEDRIRGSHQLDDSVGGESADNASESPSLQNSGAAAPSVESSSTSTSQEQSMMSPAGAASHRKSIAMITDSSHGREPSSTTNVPDELKFKELLTAGMLEEIKKDIYERLSKQLFVNASSSGNNDFSMAQDRRELHEAIAAALETQMKLAMASFHKQREDEEKKEQKEKEKVLGTPSPSKRARKKEALASTSRPSTKAEPHHPVASDGAREDDISCDQLDDFFPVDATYAMKHRFVKYRSSSSSSSPPSPNGGKTSTARAAGAQRILKACERLDQAERECKIDPISSIEVDPMGNKKSCLKVLLMGARDLPTAHLRTKNLDPYVSLAIVYPDYIVASSKQSISPSAGNHFGDSSSSLRLSNAADASSHPPSQCFRSRTKKMSMYPVWDEEFEFAPVMSLKGYLHVRILNDRKLSREQLVGEVRIPLRTLLHQKKTVDWFTLRIAVPASSSPSDASGNRKSSTILRSSGGAIRLQLQLTYSRLEKYKRAVDELVTKYFHEHNQLPPFIDAVTHHTDRRKAHNQEQHDECDSLGHRFATREDAEALDELQQQQQQQLHHSQHGVPETESPAKDSESSPLRTFDSWRAEQAEAAQLRSREAAHVNEVDPADYGSSGEMSPQRTSTDVMIASHIYDSGSLATHGGGFSAPRLSAERSRLLWESSPPHRETAVPKQQQSNSTVHPTVQEQAYFQPAPKPSYHDTMKNRSSFIHGSSSTVPRYPSRATPTSSRSSLHASMAATMKVSLSAAVGSFASTRGKSATNSHGNPASPTRRKTTGTASERPECFDDYSPYHPDFKFTDVLDLGNNDPFAKKRKPTNLYAWQASRGAATSDFNRKTDLRIFKSPGFSRRQPSTGFPERYIGLDNQTCERLKRIFGRMDGGTAG